MSGGETCDTDVLNTDTGPVNLRAEFEPETINLRWYNGNERINVPSASNTCTYDTAISLPTNPTKPGYKFKGWKVIDVFSTFDTTVNGEHRFGHGKLYPTDEDYCLYDGETNGVCDERFNDLNAYQWKTVFNHGIFYGDSMCSTVFGTSLHSGNPTNNHGTGCWCKLTKYRGNDNAVFLAQNPEWIFLYETDECNYDCASRCAWLIQYSSSYREVFFSQSNN